MKIKWLIVLLFSYFIFLLFIKDSHIRLEYKLIHYVTTFVNKIVGIGSSFNRGWFDFFSNFVIQNPKHFQGLHIEKVEIYSDFEKDLKNEKSFLIHLIYNENFIKQNQKLPVLIYIHGGGFVIDFKYKNDIHFANEGILVISINYRLAPEHKFPTAIEDCYSTMEWLSHGQNEIIKNLADLDRLSVIGDSAGGNLAAVLSHLLRDRKNPLKLSHQILVYPTMNSKNKTQSRVSLAKSAYILNVEVMDWFLDQYISEKLIMTTRCVIP
jgi:acetyl esterase/lipase